MMNLNQICHLERSRRTCGCLFLLSCRDCSLFPVFPLRPGAAGVKSDASEEKAMNEVLVTFVLATILLLAGPAAGKMAAQVYKPAAARQAPQPVPAPAEIEQYGPDLTLWQAQRAIVAGFQNSPWITQADPGSFRFSFDSFEFNATLLGHRDSKHFKVDLKALPQAFIKQAFARGYRLKDAAGKYLPDPLDKVGWLTQDRQTAESFANALNHLREMAGEQSAALRDFPQAAAAWRALSSRPPISEAVRAQRLLAENAFNDKKLDEALYHYERSVEIDPLWPEGRFNAALVAAELQFYDEAAEQMRAYLELVPNAPEAQAARDNIVIWQDKARQKAVTVHENQPSRSTGGFVFYRPK
jgi:tetratricopeptide (TPR) repeat protein